MVVHLETDNADAYYNRGMAHVHLQQLSLAIEDFTKTVELEPTHVHAVNNRAMAHYEAFQIHKAIEDSEQVLLIDPRHASAYAVRAMARARLGDDEAARDDTAQAVELGFDGRVLGALLAQASMGRKDRELPNKKLCTIS